MKTRFWVSLSSTLALLAARPSLAQTTLDQFMSEANAVVVATARVERTAASSDLRLEIRRVLSGSLPVSQLELTSADLRQLPLDRMGSLEILGVWFLRRGEDGRQVPLRLDGRGQKLEDFCYPISAGAVEVDQLKPGKEGVLYALRRSAEVDTGSAYAVFHLVSALRHAPRSTVLEAVRSDSEATGPRADLVRAALGLLVGDPTFPALAAQITSKAQMTPDLLALLWAVDRYAAASIENVGKLVESLQDIRDDKVKLRFLALLGRTHTPEAIDALAPYLDSANPDFRRIALSAVMEWAAGAPPVVPEERDEQMLQRVAKLRQAAAAGAPDPGFDPAMLVWVRMEPEQEKDVLAYWRNWLRAKRALNRAIRRRWTSRAG